MKFLHKPFNAKEKDRIVVTFDKPTRVLLIHSKYFDKYRGGRTYEYRGGFSDQSSVEFTVPFDGTWHAIIEKGSIKSPLEIKGNAKLHKPKHRTLNGMEQNETHKAVTEYDDTLE